MKPDGAVVSLYLDLVNKVEVGDVIETRTGRRYGVTAVRVQEKGKNRGRQHIRGVVFAADQETRTSRVHRVQVTCKPILFAGPMVCAIDDGTKTVTRRIMTPQPGCLVAAVQHTAIIRATGAWEFTARDIRGRAVNTFPMGAHSASAEVTCPYGAPGGRLWVRETWSAWRRTSYEYDEWEQITRESRGGASWSAWVEQNGRPDRIEYRATSKSIGLWTPAIHMPRWASRLTLEVISIRAERLHEITEDDARREGVQRDTAPCDHTRYSCEDVGCMGPTYRSTFYELWDAINGERMPWSSNPWVWRVEFKKITE